MSLSEHNFPVTLRNITSNKRIVGSLIFAPNGELTIPKVTYNRSKKYVDYSLAMGFIEAVLEVEEKEIKEETPIENVDEDVFEEEVVSIVDKFADKKVHWTAVCKYVDQVDDVRELESLLLDARFHEIKEDGVIVNTIKDRIETLSDAN